MNVKVNGLLEKQRVRMIVSHEHKFIFIKTRKTAGTSIEVFLSDVCSDRDIVTPIIPHVDPHVARNFRGVWNPLEDFRNEKSRGIKRELYDLVSLRKFYNHIPATTLKRRLPSNIWNDYFKFCVERNPWDKTLSHYHNLNGFANGQLTIDQYLANGDFCVDHQKYTDHAGNLMVDRVIKYESLNEHLMEVMGELGIPFSGNLMVKAKSEHRQDRRSYQEVLSDKQRQLISELFSAETRLHGYGFD